MTVGAIAGALAAGLAGDAPPPGPPQARAETVVSDEAELSFDRAFFEPFRPSSALDMINRVPGFSYHKGDGGVRGLAGASGNVLIDGQRPVVKSVSLDDVIRRIPATAVLRIDVVRGGSAKLDMQGHAVVANIVRDPAGFFSVTGEVMTKFYTDHRPGRHGRLEAAMSRGDLALNGAFVWRDEKEQANTGTGRADRIDVVHGHRNRGRFETAWDREVAQANGSLEYTAGRNLFRVNVSGELEDNLQRDETRLTGPGGSHEDAVIRDFQSDQAEISVDYERTVSERLSARLLALKRIERDRTQSHSYGRGLPQTSREKAIEDESILRLAATWLASARLTWETSAEGSINVLDKTSSLVRAGFPVDLPSDEIRVEEQRANFDSGLRWQARDGLSLEVGLGFETSTIGQTGDVEQSRSLRYWKPRANLTVDPVPDVQLRLRAEQIVGQLNFNDFAASISLEPGSVSAGNPDLVPERRWLFEAAIEHRFWDRGALTLSASHAEVRDVVDLIPIDNRFDAPGNIGGGVRQEMKLSFALPLERLAVPGGLIRFNGTWRRSEVVDPVTGEERRISWERPFAGDLVISKDLPGLDSVIGADLFMGFKEVSYRLHERRSERSTSDPLARLYWDWTPDPKTTLRIQIENMSFRKRSQERVFYRGPRANDDITAIERRSATLDPFLMLRLRRRL